MAEEKRAITVADIWEGDALNRSKDAEILRTFTIGHLNLRENAGEPRTYVLNLDANWGAGKSFFLNRFKQHLEAHGHIAVYVNAWENDHSDDPFMTVVDEIQTELSSHIEQASGPEAALEKTAPLRKSAAKIIGGAVYSGGKHLVTRYIGQEAADGLKELFPGESDEGSADDGEHGKMITEAMRKSITSAVDAAGEEVLAQFRQQKEVQKNFQEQLKDLGREVLAQDGIESPIFILIDELDRCRPSYAIELLERVKHIFSLENFVYILGTDTQQLANAIKGVYGSEFDGERYLKRFVDRTYHFQHTSKDKLIEFALFRNGLSSENFVTLPEYDTTTFLSKCFSETKTEARDIRQMIEIIGTFVAAMPVNTRQIDLVSLLPMVYQRHFNLSDSQLEACNLAKIVFVFTARSQSREPRNIRKTYGEVWKDIERNSIDNFNDTDPKNSLEYWIQKKNYAELEELFRVTHVNRKKETVGQEYSRILDQVSNIT
ncbi:hypothetical protein A9D60_19220 [Leisingera sp. JC1]|nr:hypothetical protein A9D60_19220 [Leisingera sp. JC1]